MLWSSQVSRTSNLRLGPIAALMCALGSGCSHGRAFDQATSDNDAKADSLRPDDGRDDSSEDSPLETSKPDASWPDPFTPVGAFTFGADGRTEPFEVALEGAGRLFLRVGVDDARPRCVQLDPVVDDVGSEWVSPSATSIDWGPYCVRCTQRVSVGHGYGLYEFPNDGASMPKARALTVRVVLRACDSGLPYDARFDAPLPARALVEALRLPAVDDARRGSLRIDLAFVAGGQLSRASLGTDAILDGAIADVRARLGAASIDVTLGDAVDVPSESADGAPLEFSRGDLSPLDALSRRVSSALGAARPPTVVVVFAPCMIEKDPVHGTETRPDGLVPHIPGGFSRGVAADAVFIRGNNCSAPTSTYWYSAPLLGKIITHELGHYLGLYHSVEADGQLDLLADTDEHNLMSYRPQDTGAEGLSPSQLRVMREHPLVEYR